MTITALDDWVSNGWLKRHTPSDAELTDLRAIVARELNDSALVGLSLDAQLGMLYNAALKLADVALRAAGYRAGGDRHHYRVITSLRYTLGDDWSDTALYLEEIQKLRHRANYESVGLATESYVTELREVVSLLRRTIEALP